MLRQNASSREFFSSLASLLNPDYMRITHQVLLIEKNPSKFRASQYKLLFLCKRRKKQRVCQENSADSVSHSGQTPVPTSPIRSRNRRRGGSRTALTRVPVVEGVGVSARRTPLARLRERGGGEGRRHITPSRATQAPWRRNAQRRRSHAGAWERSTDHPHGGHKPAAPLSH